MDTALYTTGFLKKEELQFSFILQEAINALFLSDILLSKYAKKAVWIQAVRAL
jgi:hypothetical protein